MWTLFLFQLKVSLLDWILHGFSIGQVLLFFKHNLGSVVYASVLEILT
jgi:hypothetical protein